MMMRTQSKIVLLVLLLWPALASAQQASGIAGVVRDASGAVLPGVTVEASSPALIEKVRTVVTDGEGRYNVVDLLPGVYTVTAGRVAEPHSSPKAAQSSHRLPLQGRRRLPPGMPEGQPIGLVRDRPVSRRGRVTMEC
jgi:hypothetical protein